MGNRRILLGCLVWLVVGVMGCATAVFLPHTHTHCHTCAAKSSLTQLWYRI